MTSYYRMCIVLLSLTIYKDDVITTGGGAGYMDTLSIDSVTGSYLTVLHHLP